MRDHNSLISWPGFSCLESGTSVRPFPQLRSSIERFVLDESAPLVHFIALDRPLALLHQDADGMVCSAPGDLSDGSICHLISPNVPAARGASRSGQRHITRVAGARPRLPTNAG